MAKRRKKSRGAHEEKKTFMAVTVVTVVAIVGLLGLLGPGGGPLTGSAAASATITTLSSDYFLMTLLMLVGIGLAGLYVQKEKLF